jgi:RNA polymerase sigma-70 factor (ECF subfamily)
MTALHEPRFRALIRDHEQAIARLSRGFERDPDRRRDLQQEILLAVWRALPAFRGDCSDRTWILRIAHNVAATHAARGSRDRVTRASSLEDVELPALEQGSDRGLLLDRVHALVERLRPLDRQVLLLWLEGLSTKEIADLAGLSATNVSTKVHRAKALLARSLAEAP